jgi:4-amino-4-deoxy-L-arabinose transferase-like glycosyltransferase
MFIILAPVFFVFVWLILFNRRPERGIRRAFLEAALVFYAFIAVVTEVLSLFNALTAPFLIGLWGAAALVLLAKFRRDLKDGAVRLQKDLRVKFETVPKFYLVLTLFIYLVTLVLALVSPPNTYDSMTYHLARVGHWIQSGSVGHYTTVILRQLYQPPLAEYGILHLQLLSGSDYFANLVQWFALAGTGAGVSLIVRDFGQNAKMQGLAALLSATLPAAIVQGSSTQNDLIVSFFIIAFFYFWLAAVKSNAWRDFIWTGLALGLAILTKGSAYVFCFPIGLFFTVVHFLALKHSPARKRFIGQVALVLLLALAFNFGHYARNTKLFGSPVSTGGEEVGNKNLTVRMALSNVARNYTLHLGTTSKKWKLTLEDAMKRLFGDELKNPNSTWLADDFGFEINYSTHEDSAGNFVHLLLITLAVLLVFFIRGDDRRYLYGLGFSIVFGFILFSLLLKWQIWGSRLQMPLFMLGTVLATVFIARLLPRTGVWAAILCFITALSFLFYSAPRRVLSDSGKFVLNEPRATKYFKNLPDLEPYYTEAVNFIKERPAAPEEVGLFIEYNEYEYPLWVLLKKDFRQKPYFRHVGVTNVSSKFNLGRPMPEFIISTRTETTIENVEYKEVWTKAPLRVLQKKEAPTP